MCSMVLVFYLLCSWRSVRSHASGVLDRGLGNLVSADIVLIGAPWRCSGPHTLGLSLANWSSRLGAQWLAILNDAFVFSVA